MKRNGWVAGLIVCVMLLALLPGAALAADNYDLWVNGVQVTSDNAGDVLGNGAVSYNAQTNTLTLNGAAITIPNPDTVHSVYQAGIYAGGDINVVLTGENTISMSGQKIVAGIHANGVMQIGGQGSLTINAASTGSEARALSTGYTENEAGVVINGGTITARASGDRGIYGVYVDGSYGTTPPTRYLRINGGTVELDAQSTSPYSCYATNTKPDLSSYEGYAATAILNSWEELQDYNENSWGYYRYIKVQPLVYDENGISEDKEHFQPATLGDDGYYQIQNAGNLFWFAKKLAADEANATLNARLVDDITMPEGMNWVAMKAGLYGTPYNGTFDGAGHTISNLSVASDSMAGVYNNEGLFRTIGPDGVVKNLGLIHPSVKQDSYTNVGAICGTNKGTIENCYNLGGEITVGAVYGGGITGQNEGIIRRCYHTGTVTSASGSSMGGIAGYSNGGEIIDCYNTGDITGAWYVGGICGQFNGGTIQNCYGAGSATATYPGYGSTAHLIAGVRLGAYTLQNTYYVNTTENNDGGKTAAQFASGEVAYLLNAGRSETVWGQTLGTQTAPVLGGAPVYAGYAFCYSTDISYSNDKNAVFDEKPAHRFTVIQDDADVHWYACANEGCPEIYGTEAHRGGEATYYHGPLCEVCGREYGPPKDNPLDDTDDVTPENLTVDDKGTLEETRDALKKELEENAGGYTQAQKEALEQRLEEIETMISYIENAEEVEAEIEVLPDTLASGDSEEIERVKAVKARYDRLTDVEKRLVSKAALAKLNTLIEQVEAIENAKPPQTGDRANVALWTALLLLSGAAAGAAIRWRKRNCHR